MNIKPHLRFLAFGLVLLSFGGSLAQAQVIEPSSALSAIETESNANVTLRPDTLFCVTYNAGDETCISEAALLASEESEPGATTEALPAANEIVPLASESEPPSLYWADAIKVAITETVTIAAPGQKSENSEPDIAGLPPPDTAVSEPTATPDETAPTRDGAD